MDDMQRESTKANPISPATGLDSWQVVRSTRSLGFASAGVEEAALR
jgi:hypothetical protein